MERRKKVWLSSWIQRLSHPFTAYSLLGIVLIGFVVSRGGCKRRGGVSLLATGVDRAERVVLQLEDVVGKVEDHVVLYPRGWEEEVEAMKTERVKRLEASVKIEARRVGREERAAENSPASVATGGVESGKPKGLELGRHMCIIQPVKSLVKTWTVENVDTHVALRAFLPSFVQSIDPVTDRGISYTIFYGYDTSDPVFGDDAIREAFRSVARKLVDGLNVSIELNPVYGLEGRLTGIWNDLARSAYYKGCDYFFMSNDDMAIYTKGECNKTIRAAQLRFSTITPSPPISELSKLPVRCNSQKNKIRSGWASLVMHSFKTSKYRRCRYLGLVRFKDRWAKWATFTFHVSTRLHMDIFDKIYYHVPYHNSHNDLWIHEVYRHFGSNLNKDIKVRNRIHDFYNDTKSSEPPR